MEGFDYLEEVKELSEDDGSEGLVERLEKSTEEIRDILRENIEEIDEELRSRKSVYDKITDQLEKSIRKQSDELDRAERSAGGNQREVRERLDDLYSELRREFRKYWQDRQELLKEKRRLRRILQEFEDDGFADSELV